MFRRAIGSVMGGDTRGSDGRFADPTQMNPAPQQQQREDNQTANNVNTGGGGNGNQTLPDDFAALTSGMWDDPATRRQPPAQQGNNGQQPQQQNQQNGDGQQQPKSKTFDEHVAGLNFHQIPAFNAAEVGQIQQGDFKPMYDRMSEMAKGVYRQAMADSFKLVSEKMEATVTEAVGKANTTRHTEAYVEALHEALPFTRNKGVKPLATSVFSRFLGMGQDRDTAIANTKRYFAELSTLAADEGGDGRSYGGNTRGGNSTGGKQEDWLDFMTDGR